MKLSLQGGFLPNVFKVLSHRPAEFRAFFAYYNELMNKDTGLYWPLCNKNMLKPGEMWAILGVQILNILCKTLPQPPPSSTACLYTWTMQDAYVTMGLYHHSLRFNFTVRFSQISGFLVYFQADLRRLTVSWLWWPPAPTTSVSTVWYPTAHCTGSTPKSPILLIRYRIFMTSPVVLLWLQLMLNCRPCDLPHVATRSSLTITTPTYHLESMPCWTLRWQYVTVTPSRSSISRLWRNTALIGKTPGTSPPLPLSSPCPIGSHTSPIWDQMRSFITWAVYQGTRARMVDQWKVTNFLVLLMLAARFVVAVICDWDLNWDVLWN